MHGTCRSSQFPQCFSSFGKSSVLPPSTLTVYDSKGGSRAGNVNEGRDQRNDEAPFIGERPDSPRSPGLGSRQHKPGTCLAGPCARRLWRGHTSSGDSLPPGRYPQSSGLARARGRLRVAGQTLCRPAARLPRAGLYVAQSIAPPRPSRISRHCAGCAGLWAQCFASGGLWRQPRAVFDVQSGKRRARARSRFGTREGIHGRRT